MSKLNIPVDPSGWRIFKKRGKRINHRKDAKLKNAIPETAKDTEDGDSDEVDDNDSSSASEGSFASESVQLQQQQGVDIKVCEERIFEYVGRSFVKGISLPPLPQMKRVGRIGKVDRLL